MPPKFESTFIPKGPASSASVMPGAPRKSQRSLLGFIASLIFAISVIAALGSFGYKWYLGYSIEKMKMEFESGKAALDPETVGEITRLNNRILAADNLINKHTVLTPLFRYLEASTIRNVRFTNFHFESTKEGLSLILKGEARGYTALALQAEEFKKVDNLNNPTFSDLRLDDRGNVTFSVESMINPNLLSYRKEVERIGQPTTNNLQPTTGTSTATTTNRTSTTTNRTSTSTPR